MKERSHTEELSPWALWASGLLCSPRQGCLREGTLDADRLMLRGAHRATPAPPLAYVEGHAGIMVAWRGKCTWLNHGRSQILDAPAQAIPANVPGVVHNQLLCYIQSLRHSLICTRASDMPLPGMYLVGTQWSITPLAYEILGPWWNVNNWTLPIQQEGSTARPSEIWM